MRGKRWPSGVQEGEHSGLEAFAQALVGHGRLIAFIPLLRKAIPMQETTQSLSLEGIQLNCLDPGSILDVETKSRHYRIEYVGGDEILIAGHPRLCPAPVPAELCGSLRRSGEVQAGFVGLGLRLSFRRLTDDYPVFTSEIQNIHQEDVLQVWQGVAGSLKRPCRI
jgi:hypothetical protein